MIPELKTGENKKPSNKSEYQWNIH